LLSPPPLDANGEVIPHDHPEIQNEHWIIRRVSGQETVFDPKVQGRRLSTAVFSASSGKNGGISVDLQNEIEAAGLDPAHHVTTPRWTASIRLQCVHFRARDLKVGYEPLPENPHHGEVWGQLSRAKKGELLAEAEWLVPIPSVNIT
jgi:hypothetical protein